MAVCNRNWVLAMSHLDDVLAYLDTHRTEARNRLCEWLRIESISTDPAYKGECVEAAEWLKAELTSLGIGAEVAPTGGHPVVLGHIEGKAKNMHFFMAIMMFNRLILCLFGRALPLTLSL